MTTTADKKRLPVVTKCYDAVERSATTCMRKTCKQWIDHAQGKNCMILTTRSGPLTLNEIGQIYGLTRMRICQIERVIFQKIRQTIRL